MDHRIRILYAEDSPEDVELTLRTLKKAGLDYEHSVSSDLSELGRLIEGGAFDVFLSDYNLRKFDARALLRKRNEAAPDMPFIIVTGTLPDESALELVREGATDYVLKDRLSRLPAAISMALKERDEKRNLDAARWELEESEKRFRDLFETSTDLIFMASLDGTLTMANPAFMLTLGVGQAGVPRLKAAELAPDGEREALAAALAAAAAGRGSGNFETALAAAGGRRLTAEGAVHPRVKEGRPVYVYGVFRDVTEHRELEAQFRQAQKMDAVGRLAGGIAHDFNNILGVIEGYATLLERGLPEGSPQQPDAEEIKKAVQRGAELTRRLLIFSRKQPMQKKPVSVNAVVENVQRMLLRVIGENVKLSLDLKPGLPQLPADQPLLEQLLLNLAVNARDAMPQGGEVVIRTAAADIPAGEAKCPHPEEAGRGFVRLSVADTGTGIPPQVMEHLFEPFFTTKEKGKGTGLGLATVYGIAKQHNGWVEAANRPGGGAEFAVLLPVARTVCAPAERQDEAPAGAPLRTARVLIAEDDRNLRELAERGLSAYGHNVSATASAAEAMRVFKAAGGAFDVFFSDMFLGDNKATELTDEMLAINPSIKFIFTSGYFDNPSDWDAVAERGYPFLQKPYSLETLQKTLEGLLSGDLRKK